jgi:Lhr-like helicase
VNHVIYKHFMILYNILYYNTMNNSVQSAISYGLRSLGYSEAMDAQRRVIEAYMAGRDVLMVAPTGQGKA